MKLRVDDVRPAPEGYVQCKSVNQAKRKIYSSKATCIYIDGRSNGYKIDLIDIDHDAGDYAYDGGDYIKLLDWLEETCRSYPIHIHSMNPVGVANMRAIIQKNGWIEV